VKLLGDVLDGEVVLVAQVSQTLAEFTLPYRRTPCHDNGSLLRHSHTL
jgi:hypothetical protein